MKCTKFLSKPSTGFWGSMKCTKLVMDEMYKIGRFIANFQYEYSRICVVLVVDDDMAAGQRDVKEVPGPRPGG